MRNLFLFIAAAAALPAQEPVVFRSDVALVRVDAQVVDRNNRAITGLTADDFVLRDRGRVQDIRNFAREEMPVDFLFLLDVSASMRPHVERIARAARDAVRAVSDNDRFAIMVFDRASRLSLPFRGGRSHLEDEFNHVLQRENFRGGTDITRGMKDAIAYIDRNGRKEARRAIVVLTDDQTERGVDEDGVISQLERADTVMSALIAPDALAGRNRSYGGGRRLPGGVIIGGGPGGVWVPNRTRAAGTEKIARQSGGDTMDVDDASALETTLARLRQRYTLHYNAGADGALGRSIDVQLASAAARRYPDAEVHFRRVYMGAPGESAMMVSKSAVQPDAEPKRIDEPPILKRRRTVNEDGTAVAVGDAPEIVKPGSETPAPVRGWRRVSESKQP